MEVSARWSRIGMMRCLAVIYDTTIRRWCNQMRSVQSNHTLLWSIRITHERASLSSNTQRSQLWGYRLTLLSLCSRLCRCVIQRHGNQSSTVRDPDCCTCLWVHTLDTLPAGSRSRETLEMHCRWKWERNAGAERGSLTIIQGPGLDLYSSGW